MNCRHDWIRKVKKITDKLEFENKKDMVELSAAMDQYSLEEEKKSETSAA